jgi:aminoglycoside/choline kinase family phosphotransferase
MEKILQLCIDSGIKDPEIIPLKGDYSMRRIFRIRSSSGTLIAVSGPDIAENEAFLSFRKTFEECGFDVPAFIAVSEAGDVYLLEDLGDTTVKKYCDLCIEKGDTEAVKEVYRQIGSILPRLQRDLFGRIDFTKCYQSQIFGRENMESDIERFERYFLDGYLKKYNRTVFRAFKEEIISKCDSKNKNYFLYRDYQTRNIMMKNGRLFFIDFQSGRKGSFYYDLASFLYSSGTYRYEGIDKEIISSYIAASGSSASYDRSDFMRDLYSFAVLRIMQALGNYAYYYVTRGNKSIEDKKDSSLEILTKLSEELNIDTGF